MNNKYVIPEGMRDLILGECEVKKKLQKDIEEVLDRWGYKEVVTPTIEYYQTINSGFQNLKEEEVYKFFDSKGKILVLRPDMTVPIARVAATKFKNIEKPLRFRYTADVFRLHKNFGGKKNEYTDCGVELIGLKDKDSDLEILEAALETLEVLGDTKFKLEMGHMDFFNAAVKDLNLDEEKREKLATLIDKKSLKSLSDYLDELNLSEEYKNFFNELPLLFGGIEVLEKAKKLAFNKELKESISYLESLYNDLRSLGYKESITFDLAMVPRLNYYTGLIFRGFVDGVGATVLSGGRYDKLIKTFGKDYPAIGFSVNLDTLLSVLDIKNADDRDKFVIYYGKDNKIEALKKAKGLRQEGNVVELIPTKECSKFEIKKEV